MPLAPFQIASLPLPSDLPRRNYTGSDIPAYLVVKIDSANLLNATAGADAVGVTPTTANSDIAAGVTMTDLAVGGDNGRVRTVGDVPVTIDGTVTAGQELMPSGVNPGNVVARTTTNSRVGIALMSGTVGQTILMQIALQGAQ